MLRVSNLAEDPVKAGLDGIASAGVDPASAQAGQLAGGLDQVRQGLAQSFGMPIPTLTAAINVLFQSNEAFGPHHFMENKDYFELQGVFYHPNSPAKWVHDWSFSVIDPIGNRNISHSGDICTTHYQIVPSQGGECRHQ